MRSIEKTVLRWRSGFELGPQTGDLGGTAIPAHRQVGVDFRDPRDIDGGVDRLAGEECFLNEAGSHRIFPCPVYAFARMMLI